MNSENQPSFLHLGVYSDLVSAARKSAPFFPWASPGPETQRLVHEALAFAPGPPIPQDVRVEKAWERDGVAGELVSWSVGYGPRTAAYFLRPLGATEPLPGLLALHDHGGYKFFGKEKIAEGPDGLPPALGPFVDSLYAGRCPATEAARRGFAVLVPDTFLWGSRKFPLETIQLAHGHEQAGTKTEVESYNAAAGPHEHTVNKYCQLLGASLAGVISFEDRVALSYLASRPEVSPESLGCFGLSGGGLRSGLMQATDERIRAAVVVGLMSTYQGLLDRNIVSHTWMFFPAEWSRHGDWPDLVGCRAPSPLLVQYDEDDALFTLEGQQAAHHRLQRHYEFAGAFANYEGQFYPGPHKFDIEMQDAAFQWLQNQLGGGRVVKGKS